MTTEGPGARIIRLYLRFIGFGYLAYFLLLLPHIAAEARIVAAWWTPVAVLMVFGTGSAVAATSYSRFAAGRRTVPTAAALSYLPPALLWLPAWTESPPPETFLWFSAIPGLAGMCAAVTWPARFALAYTALLVAITQALNYRSGAAEAWWFADLVTNVSYSLLLVGAACIAVRTARTLDATRAQAPILAGQRAARAAEDAERRLFVDLVHTWVIATLLGAARGSTPAPELKRNAGITIDKLRALAEDEPRPRPIPAKQAIARLRLAAGEVGAGVRIHGRSRANAAYPADVIEAICAGVQESLRNSQRHAGPDVVREVRVSLRDSGVRVTITDDGPGFRRSDLPADRLGVTSIQARLTLIPGGFATVRGRPGRGVRVDLRWRRPSGDPADIRQLLGMRQPIARVTAVSYLTGTALQAITADEGVEPWWPVGVAIAIFLMAGLSLLLTQGDPVPVGSGIAIMVAQPLSTALVCAVVPWPVTSGTQLWPLFATTTLSLFLCVRGRTGLGWGGFAMTSAVTIAWAANVGGDVVLGLVLTTINAAPLTMATIFARTIRPAANAIFVARQQEISAAERHAEQVARLSLRRSQLATLDPEIHELLCVAATYGQLDPKSRKVALLHETHLRSIARAPGLADPLVTHAAWNARRRGAVVNLFDDGADRLATLTPEQRTLFLTWAADRLDQARPNSVVTLRVNPAHRATLATVVGRHEGRTFRRSYP
ncbi:sensor histidine kinase [Nocardia camponoti]|uniref:ATP-binding protein n=1 Tax=Nocardia camponoti TaxID=1616106 RepID=A0A917Q6R7_9NOCA|nr:hypothetical protein [Nocardia camponoti]GGK32698.1 hypothetical protein GCM10011591_00510 [Nocardia camponoti]